MRLSLACLIGVLLLGACRVPLDRAVDTEPGAGEPVAGEPGADARGTRAALTLGVGASPGNGRGPGGFVPRKAARNFYAGAGGRLWYYMNHYYWVPPATPTEDLWIRAEVEEEFRDLRRWPNGVAVAGPEPKVTVEYWEVGKGGRSVRLDNHKDYCLLSDRYSAGSIVVRVTLTLGRLVVCDGAGRWGPPEDAYVLESRNYSGGGGIGPACARFEALQREAETVWGYQVPWSTHPQRLTRSSWLRLAVPAWRLLERRAPPAAPAPVLTPGDTALGSPDALLRVHAAARPGSAGQRP